MGHCVSDFEVLAEAAKLFVTARLRQGFVGQPSLSFHHGLPAEAAKQRRLVPSERIGLSTSPLPRVCSTTELRRHIAARCHSNAAQSR